MCCNFAIVVLYISEGMNVELHSLTGRHLMQQAGALYDGGADLFLVETIFDTLNAKAAIYALERFFEDKGLRIPVLISGTIVDKSGRTLSGQTNEAFWLSIQQVRMLLTPRCAAALLCYCSAALRQKYGSCFSITSRVYSYSMPKSSCHVLQARPFAVGLNCALGAADMQPYIANLAKCADCYVFAYPNAGLPNAMGGYDQKGDEMAAGQFACRMDGSRVVLYVCILGACSRLLHC